MNIHKNARTTPYSRAEIMRRVLVLRERVDFFEVLKAALG